MINEEILIDYIAPLRVCDIWVKMNDCPSLYELENTVPCNSIIRFKEIVKNVKKYIPEEL